MKKTISILLLAILVTGCSYTENDYEAETQELYKNNEVLESNLAMEKQKTQRLEAIIDGYESEIIPNLQRELEEQQQFFEKELGNLREENKGLEYLMLWFKKDIDEVLSYLYDAENIPVYEGEEYSYIQEHMELIKKWFSEFSEERFKEIPPELIDLLYPVVYPIKVIETEVGFKSQYEDAYYYNVAHYMTYGMEGEYKESKMVRAIGGNEDGFRKTYIIEIYRDKGEWKIGYTGFGG